MAEVIKSGKGLAVRLPGYVVESLKLKDGDEVDFDLAEGSTAQMRKLHSVSSDELRVLRKLNDVKFSDRTKDAISEKLSSDEQKILDSLVKKKVVSFYDKDKYKERGVYSISRDYYYLLSKKEQPKELKSGFFIADDYQNAMRLMEEFKPQLQSGEIISVRSFNKKFFFVTSELVNSVGSELVAMLETGELTLDQLSEQMRMNRELVQAVLEVLRESGDIIEKKKELYALA